MSSSRRERHSRNTAPVPARSPALRIAIFPASLYGGHSLRMCSEVGGRFCDSLRRLARRERPVRACGGGAAWGHGGGRAGVARLAQLVLQPLQRHQRRRAALRLRRQAPHQRAGCQHRYADVSRYGRDPLLPLCAVFIGAAELLWVWRNRVLTELLSVQGSSSGTRSASPPSPSARTGSTALCVPAARTTAACGCGTRRGWS